MKPQCNSAADCLRELARVMDQFGIADILEAVNSKFVKFDGWRYRDQVPEFFTCESWKFAIAEVEGKPVFVGDELFNEDGTISIVTKHMPLLGLSWNPPKPKTIMVEMSVEDAAYFVNAFTSPQLVRLGNRCKKALEELK